MWIAGEYIGIKYHHIRHIPGHYAPLIILMEFLISTSHSISIDSSLYVDLLTGKPATVGDSVFITPCHSAIQTRKRVTILNRRIGSIGDMRPEFIKTPERIRRRRLITSNPRLRNVQIAIQKHRLISYAEIIPRNPLRKNSIRNLAVIYHITRRIAPLTGQQSGS